MLAPDVHNPFHTPRVDDCVTLPAGHVPDLHAHVISKCTQALAQARHSGIGTGLLVVGEAGSGKSHLLAQLRQQLAGDPRAVLAAVRLGGAFAGRIWRHLRERLVEELMRQYEKPAHGANGLLRILRNRFPRWASLAQGSSGGLLDWLLGRTKQADLDPHLEEFARSCTLDYNLLQVLPQLANPELTRLATHWLQGRQLGGRDLQKLGLPPVFPSEQEQETQAQDVVLSFLRLAGDQTTLVICFDEVEAIQAGTWDAAALRQFTTMATGLLAETGPRVILTSIRPNLQDEVQKSVEKSNVEKMSQLITHVPSLDWEQAVQIVRARLDAEPTCRSARQRHPHDLDWPLGLRFLEKTFADNKRSLTPRHLILACRVEFDRLLKGKPVETAAPAEPELSKPGPTPVSPSRSLLERPAVVTPPPPPRPAEDSRLFQRMWERQRDKYLGKLHALHFDTVMALGIPWLAKQTEVPYVREATQRFGDVPLVFQPRTQDRKAVGIALCNDQPMTLWRKLDRVCREWQRAKGRELGSLVVLRSEAERTTATAAERLGGLRLAGAQIVLVNPQQLAELAAFQCLLTAALEGDLTREGKPVEASEYDAWVRGNLSDSVKEFLDSVFEPQAAAPQPRVRVATARK
jgi:hypothetical protein